MLKEMKSDNPIVAPDCPVVVGGSPIEHLSICEIECDHTRQRSRNYLDLVLAFNTSELAGLLRPRKRIGAKRVLLLSALVVLADKRGFE